MAGKLRTPREIAEELVYRTSISNGNPIDEYIDDSGLSCCASERLTESITAAIQAHEDAVREEALEDARRVVRAERLPDDGATDAYNEGVSSCSMAVGMLITTSRASRARAATNDGHG